MHIFKRILLGVLALAVLAGLGAWAGWSWLMRETEPKLSSEPFYVRFEDSTPLATALASLQEKGVVRNADALKLYARWKKGPPTVASGTYQVRPGLKRDEILKVLQEPVQQMVRLSERKWAARNAPTLEKNQVGSADEYVSLAAQPLMFEKEVEFKLPATSLEGYLYPDTYDLPPLLGAKATIERQLRAFQEKAYEELGKPANLHRLVTVASMIELEVALDEERPIVAGVIENRLRLGMPLQIDATILYGLGKWRTLTTDDYRNVISPYNTYLHKGLPPGPICSPSIKSLKAAQKPAKHNFLYYVAIPDGSLRHLFSKSYSEHLRNVRRRRHEIASQNREDAS